MVASLAAAAASPFSPLVAMAANLDESGKYSLTFTRTATGSCEIIARFLGNSEYLASAVTKTYAC